jgi:fatty-acyl-CoA synthase
VIESLAKPSAAPGESAAKAWARALSLTAPIPRNPERTLSRVLEELADTLGDAPALLSERECLSYGGLVQRQNQYARWALEQNLAKGDVVCLLVTNRPEYFAAWLGIASAGGVVALVNTTLVGPSLAHSINVVGPKHLIVGAEFLDALNCALPQLRVWPTIWTHGAGQDSSKRVDQQVEQQSGEKLTAAERPPVTIDDRALLIFTSGTTGMPKAAIISHARVLHWSCWFAGLMGAQPSDRLYNCLPMYHSIGGILAPGAALMGGGSVVIRSKFSARQFWRDVIDSNCTLFQYIGELCRYLLHATSPEDAAGHTLRMACGNGLAPEVWKAFQERFQIPRILEFYAATEGGISLFNVEGKRGSIGRVPPYLVHRFSPALVRFDAGTGAPARNEYGLCIPCAPNETGEALGNARSDPTSAGSRFEGYTDQQASEGKLVRDVFKPGDLWVRTGDLMRRDENGFFYFVDRIGDTFRWKGENVSTLEVAEAISSFPGVKHAVVYGVAIPAAEGRAGMATLVVEDDLDLAALRRYLVGRLTPFARPLFVRIGKEVDLTGTFKYSKAELAREGYDPARTTDVICFDSPEAGRFVRMDDAQYARIQLGQVRL